MSLFGEFFQLVWTDLVSWFRANLIQPIKDMFTGSWETILSNLAVVVASIISKFVPLRTFFPELLAGIEKAFVTTFGLIGKFIDTTLRGLGRMLSTLDNLPSILGFGGDEGDAPPGNRPGAGADDPVR